MSMPNDNVVLSTTPQALLLNPPVTAEQVAERLGNIKLIVNGLECNQWDDISIDSDIGIPADGWSFAWLGVDLTTLPDVVKSGAVCQISLELKEKSRILMVGVIDKIQQTVSRGQIGVAITGRDLAGQLLDTSAPITQGQNMTLEEIIHRFIFNSDLGSLPWQILPQDNNYLKAKVGIEDGLSVWDAINKGAEASGQYVWMSPDGAICIGNPFNVQQSQGLTFIMNKKSTEEKPNLITNITYSEDLSNAYSIVEVVGQDDKGNNFRGIATDDRLPIKRRKILNESKAENQAEAMQYAQKALHDSWLDAYECVLTLPFWAALELGWKVSFESDVMPRIVGDWVIYGRTLKLDRQNGKTTELRLRKFSDWMQPIQHVELIKDTKAKKAKKQTTVRRKRK
ncbi:MULTISPECIES: phage baseplate assembly protein [unclassified Moraxella]|uniref:phage baseplate assembly protein n=1 Tax=unclassified Moraxella TaxID=2685852 RepID=UPI003AF7170E